MSQGCSKHSRLSSQGGPLPSQGQALEALKGQETVAQLAARVKSIPGRFKPGRRLWCKVPSAFSATATTRSSGTTSPDHPPVQGDQLAEVEQDFLAEMSEP